MAIRITMGHAPDGRVGCRVNLGHYLVLHGWADSALSALHSASGLAANLADTISKHPELQALLPPGVGLAFKAIHVASAAMQSNDPKAAAAAAATPIATQTVHNLLQSASQ
jgi:hypothetical protein